MKMNTRDEIFMDQKQKMGFLLPAKFNGEVED